MEKQSGLHKWGMCTHSDTDLQLVALFTELFVFLRQTITSSDFCDADKSVFHSQIYDELYLSIYPLTHISFLAHTYFCCFASGYFSFCLFLPLHCLRLPLSCSLFRQSWANHVPTISSLALCVFLCLSFFPPFLLSASSPSARPLSSLLSLSLHLSAVSQRCCDLSLLVLPQVDWPGHRLLATFPEIIAVISVLHLLENFART